MSDLIGRQDAIDAIEQLVIPEDMCVFEILSHIELAIGTLSSAQQWIPCSERLPKYDEIVLVWYCGETRIGYLTDISENGVWVLQGSFPFKHDEKKVVAWMELPEPYEAED